MSKQGIAWLAGETSGDLIASRVLPQLQQAFPGEPMFGIGGEKLVQAGLDAWYSSSALAVRGYVEVLYKLPSLLWLRSRMINRVMKADPRAFIGVDAPDFNLGIELKLKEKGIKTIHFVCPSIWAWRPERIETIKKAVDHMLLIFPFEKELMDKAGVESTYIGHPLASMIAREPDKLSAREDLQIEPSGALFTVMPGSRAAEVKGCAPIFFAACERILDFDAKAQFLVPAADLARKAQIEQILNQFPKVKARTRLSVGNSYTCMQACDAILVASGTATLEAALFKRPLVVGYSMPGLTGLLMERKGLTPWVSLPNILAQERLVPELLQYFCRPEQLAFALWHEYERRNDAYLMKRFHQLHESLERDTPRLAAQAIEGVCR